MQRTTIPATISSISPAIMTVSCRFSYTLAILVTFGLCGCIPSRPQLDDNPDAPGASSTQKTSTKKKDTPPPAIRRQAPARAVSPGPVITSIFEDNFDRASLGENWHSLSPQWKIQNGKLCGQNARNQGVWLRHRVPVNARIEFDAISNSPDGDLKAEFWGDGLSGATSVSYTNATSYLTIFGGWKNTFHVLARVDEHAPNRLEISVDPGASTVREQPVVQGKTYRFRVQRQDKKTISWWVNDTLMHTLVDPNPLQGTGHEHVGFNDWQASVCFDNLKITPL